MKNFINFHVLISHSPSCLNRDDMNMQKSAVFGGVRRVRISSQSLKRAIRHSDYYREYLGKPSVRTRELGRFTKKCVHELEDRYSQDLVIKAIQWLSDKEGIADDTEADAVAPWVVAEVAKYCEAIKMGETEEGFDNKKLAKKIAKESAEFRAATSQGLDIALSGRMTTSGIMTPVDGALAVAHAMTTHAVDSDIDWFTAVDDLVADAGEIGAGHLNTQEFSSGVFYRYASLNIQQLQENLGGTPRERALEIAKHLAHLLATVVPSAKQQSFAAHNLADCVLVSFADIPVSLANAFEAPVQKGKAGGFKEPSVDKLLQYWQQMHRGYGLDEQAALFTLASPGTLPEKMAYHDTLAGLADWVRHGNPLS
ncbi:type I-E CRISPR-associated protein Cas7/Cse4/CasC [Nitrosococcus watsonii]|uniref:CRISPR-associated protein, Cse4 family n=1 Tax=Nitrosococcus watsoni (strain C-113) TaxID=105559 RepID=D8K5Y9_NITWC|nr:type I-E CRISPR-associated protein Cas7/Cse4/CasC [Nitrosococcus watsonii]ADJ28316.1 CRISPR-associated protein, Cse4 family [Nitrosococcus watsonii C-113]